ncbi:IclR family transcriptional regulator [Paraburkholderia sp. JHI869]|uniref:IclR family transcriptional regulator n=1 Tax=Paraburkholderia sp. JHI869 TaxID=3112959 RepID=UPI00316D7ACA
MSETAGDDKPSAIQVIARAAKILNLLSDEPEGMRLAEIARVTNLPRSTVQRIVSALAQEELLQSDRGDGVRLGPALMRMIGRVHTDVIAFMRPYLERLSAEVNETVVLARMSGRQLAYVHFVVAEHMLRIVLGVGGDLPLHSTSGGRALLALCTDAEVISLVGRDYEKVTDVTVDGSFHLMRILSGVREHGYAWESEESVMGVSSLAVAVETVFGRYAIAIVAPTARALHGKHRLVRHALKLKEDLVAEIGQGPLRK